MAALDGASRPLVETLYRHHHAWLRQWLQRRLATPSRADRPGLVIDLHRRRAIEAAYREALAALPPALNLCLQVRHESEAQGTRRRAKPSQPPES